VRDEDSGESAPPGVEAVIESPQADAGVVLRLDGAAVVPLAHDGRPHQLAITLGP
jgi:hypothetical protein